MPEKIPSIEFSNDVTDQLIKNLKDYTLQKFKDLENKNRDLEDNIIILNHRIDFIESRAILSKASEVNEVGKADEIKEDGTF